MLKFGTTRRIKTGEGNMDREELKWTYCRLSLLVRSQIRIFSKLSNNPLTLVNCKLCVFITILLPLMQLACGSVKKTEIVSIESTQNTPEQDSIRAIIQAMLVDSCIFVEKEIWLPFPFETQLKKVVAVEYLNVSQGRETSELTVGDSLVTTRFSKIVELNDTQTQQIKEIFQGYENGKYFRGACYEPRHCLYFLDENDRILSFFEICFACNVYLTSHRDVFSIGCNAQMKTLKYLFQSVGMTKFEH